MNDHNREKVALSIGKDNPEINNQQTGLTTPNAHRGRDSLIAANQKPFIDPFLIYLPGAWLSAPLYFQRRQQGFDQFSRLVLGLEAGLKPLFDLRSTCWNHCLIAPSELTSGIL